jgi:N-acetylmuramoyl-L-alanine amidase
MRLDDIFPPESIEEDFKKWAGAVAAGAIAMAPFGIGKMAEKDTMERSIAETTSILAQTMWGEARAHGKQGMLAVGWVIKNRANSGRGEQFGYGIKGVALKNKQFSCWNPGDPNVDRMQDMKEISRILKTRTPPDGQSFEEWYEKFKLSNDYKEYAMWLESFELAKKIMNGATDDPTNGALFYHTTAVRPSWSIGIKPTGKIANHLFYDKARIKKST